MVRTRSTVVPADLSRVRERFNAWRIRLRGHPVPDLAALCRALGESGYDLRGLGWQQEHYSLAPPRGQGLHRLGLPRGATRQRNGIFGLMKFDPKLFEELAARP